MSTDSVSKTSAQPDERALVVSAKQQAKRLLRLAKKVPLEVSALNQALEIVSKMHGYPTWQALSASNGKTTVPESPREANAEHVLMSKLFSTDSSDHIEKLASHAREWAANAKASVNIITPHFKALKKMPGMEGVIFVSIKDLLSLNHLATPLGSHGILPSHAHLLEMLTEALISDRLLKPSGDGSHGGGHRFSPERRQQAYSTEVW